MEQKSGSNLRIYIFFKSHGEFINHLENIHNVRIFHIEYEVLKISSKLIKFNKVKL